MGARPLTALGLQMQAALPPALRDSNDYLGIIHPLAREIERLEGCIEQVRSQFSPSTADLLLPAWETQARLAVGGAGASTAQRQQAVVTQLRFALGESEGREWEARITEMIGPGWTYEEHIPGDGTSPPENTLRITLPFPPDGSAYNAALLKIREVTAAHLEIEFSPAGGFILDESQLDSQELTY